MFDDIALVDSDGDICSKPPVKHKTASESIHQKRERFRCQIRKEQIEEELERKRMWFMPKLDQPRLEKHPQIAIIFASFREAIANQESQLIAMHLHSLALICNDPNRIHSLFLTQRKFLQYRSLLLEETYYTDTYIIYSQLTQDDEFYDLQYEDIIWSIERSLAILEICAEEDLINLILGYLANVASRLHNVQIFLLEHNSIAIIRKHYNLNLLVNVCYLTQTICNKIPAQFSNQLQQAISIFQLNTQKSPQILQTLYVIIQQAEYYNNIDYTNIVVFLFDYVQEYFRDEQDYESFYSALVQLKLISDYENINTIVPFLQCNVIDVINKLISYKYQKIRTAGLYILKNLCKGGQPIIQRVFKQSDLIMRVINILTTDKPINQSLVLQSIINILKQGNQQHCLHLLDLGLIPQLQPLLQSQEAYILLQGIECCTLIMQFGYDNHMSVHQKMNSQRITERIEQLQYHPNSEVFEQAQRFINQFFSVKNN